jgi:hypothetical protein
VCREGLWRYSRHPNYFFEWLHWWAYVFLAIGSPLWWLPMLGVAVMFLFLTRVTGIPPTEAQALRSRGDAYRAYQRTTNAFFPGPVKGCRGDDDDRDDSGQIDQRVNRSGGCPSEARAPGGTGGGREDAVGPRGRSPPDPDADAAIGLAERGWVRIRHQGRHPRAVRAAAARGGASDGQIDREALKDFIDALRDEDVAPVPEKANDQHYEVPRSCSG